MSKPRKPSLILIDIQQGFDDPVWGARSNPDFTQHVSELLAQWRERAWPIFHVRHDSLLPQSPLRSGQAGNAFMPCSQALTGETVIAKQVNSAFIGTDLLDRLRQAETQHLVMAGLCTDHCVSTTARMAANLGFTVTVLADATATFDRQDEQGQTFPAELVHRVALASLHQEFATIMDVNDCVPIFEKGIL